MKVLRVLTGNHAGARLALADGVWRVQRLDPACQTWHAQEIALMDWHAQPLSLRVGPTGCVWVDAQGLEQPWPDFEVRRFGDVVLSLGEDAAIWPSDIALLSRLPASSQTMPLSKAHASEGHMPQQMLLRNVLVIGFPVVLLIAILIVVFGSKNIQAAPTLQKDDLTATSVSQVKQALLAEELQDLEVRFEQGKIWVEGLVSDATEDALARKVLKPFDRVSLVAAWQSAIQLGDTMTTALNEPGLQVHHLGGGYFEVEGTTENPDELQAKVSKLKNDFANNVRSLDVRVQAKARAQENVSAMLEAAGLRYVVRPDGSKSFTP
jgi:type III secretion protein D